MQNEKVINVAYWIIRKTVGTLIKIIWVKKVTGIENIPKKGAVILAFNHQSYFDFLCFVAVSPRNVYFLSAEKFFSHRFWKHVMKYTGQIKVERDSHDKNQTHKVVHDHLETGKVIGIFPEGTRSPHESEMLKAFVGVAKYCIGKKCPVVPIGIKGTYEVMAKHHKKPSFKKIVEFNIGKPIHFPHLHDKVDITQKDYATVTHHIMTQVAELSGRKYSHDI